MSIKIFIIFFFILLQNAHAFKISPMEMVINPKGNSRHTQVLIENDSEQKIAVKIYITTRKINELGLEERLLSEHHFSVFPEQVILGPKQKRMANIFWKGEMNLETEEAYRVVVEQLPIMGINTEQDKDSSLKMLLKYVASLYITPSKTKAELQVLEHKIIKDQLGLTLKNQGNIHQILKNFELIFLKNKVVVGKIDAENLKSIQHENILAGGVRNFTVPLPPFISRNNTDPLEVIYLSK